MYPDQDADTSSFKWDLQLRRASLVAQMVKKSTCNMGDLGLIPGLGRSLGGGNGNPLQYSCLGNLMDTGAWQATVYEAAKELDTTQWLNNNNTQNSDWHLREVNVSDCFYY